jgi:membrane-associated HD superfamily phosphohydrolase
MTDFVTQFAEPACHIAGAILLTIIFMILVRKSSLEENFRKKLEMLERVINILVLLALGSVGFAMHSNLPTFKPSVTPVTTQIVFV